MAAGFIKNRGRTQTRTGLGPKSLETVMYIDHKLGLSCLQYIRVLLLITIPDIWQFGSSLDICLVNISLFAPVTKAKKSTNCVNRKLIANMRKKKSAFTEDTFDINGGS